MNESTQVKSAALLLRVTLGVMYIAHSVVLKAFIYGLQGTAGYFESIGLPGVLAYVVFTAELIGGVLLLAGWFTRAVSLALIPILIGATWVHSGNGWVFSNQGGGWEYPIFLIIASIVLALLAAPRREGASASVPAPAMRA